ncbi:hypothetical protein MRX96_057130 [Rhipicephalus microplus]
MGYVRSRKKPRRFHAQWGKGGTNERLEDKRIVGPFLAGILPRPLLATALVGSAVSFFREDQPPGHDDQPTGGTKLANAAAMSTTAGGESRVN